MGIFSKPKEIIRDSDGAFRCPTCNCDLSEYIDSNLTDSNPIMAVGLRTDIITRQGLTCRCGKELAPYKMV